MATAGGGAGGRGCPNYQGAKTIGGHAAGVVCAIVGNGLVCTGSIDKTIRVLDSRTYEILFVLDGHKFSVVCIAFVPDTSFLASGGFDGSILIFDLSTRKLSYSLPGGHSDCVRSLLTVPGTTLLVSCSKDKTIKVWDVVARTCVHTLAGHTDFVFTLANVPGNVVASGSEDGSIRFWDPASGTCLRSISGAHSGGPVGCLVFVPGLDLLASGGGDGYMKLWDAATGEVKATFTDKHAHMVWGLAVIPDTNLLASCSYDKSIKIWDATTGKCVQTLTGPWDYVFSIAVDPSSTESLLSVSSDRTLKVWTNLKAASAHRRYCVLACLSILTAKLYAGEEYAAAVEGEAEEEEGAGEGKQEGGGGQGLGGGSLQGVLAFESIASADLWRYILEFV